MVNITGGSDIKLFEVDAAVNKIRAEVDPEAELIFGAIKDENMNGKIRVSIVATALNGSDTKPYLSLVDTKPNVGLNNRSFTNGDSLFNSSFVEKMSLIQLREQQLLNWTKLTKLKTVRSKAT